MAAYGLFVAALAGIASFIGVFDRGDGAFVSVTSSRGIVYDMATNGVYAYNAKQVVAEGVGWDVFTLFVVVPATVATMWFVARGSFRAQLVALGLFGYYLYEYLEYAVTWAFGPVFLMFVGIYALSLIGTVWFSVSVARDGIHGRFAADFPRRAFVALNVVMSLLLALMWLGRIAAGLSGDLKTAGLVGETTLTVQALDLGLVVPVALLAAFLVWRRSEIGYTLAAAYIVTSLAMSAAIVSMMVSASIVNNDPQVAPVVIFGVLALASALIALRIYRGIRNRVTVDEPSGKFDTGATRDRLARGTA